MNKKYQAHNVPVIELNGLGLMPTTPRKARKLLEAHRAKVVNRHPFTIQLKYKTGCKNHKICKHDREQVIDLIWFKIRYVEHLREQKKSK